jgi:hypothetical protein
VAKDASASHGAIIDLFECLEGLFKRLGVYAQISLTTEMAGVLVEIMIELLDILSVATMEVKRPIASKSSQRVIPHDSQSHVSSETIVRKLLGMTDIKDAIKRLDRLIQWEVQMVIVQTLKVATEGKDSTQPY